MPIRFNAKVFLKHSWPLIAFGVAFYLISLFTSPYLFATIEYFNRLFVTSSTGLAYGAIVVCAFLETIILIAQYFPGTTILTVCFLLLEGGFYTQSIFLLSVWIGIQLGCIMSFLFGYHFSNSARALRENRTMKQVDYLISKFGPYASLFAAVHPNLIGPYFIILGLNTKVEFKLFAWSALFSFLFLIFYGILLKVFYGVAENVGITAQNHPIYVASALVGAGLIVGIRGAISLDHRS